MKKFLIFLVIAIPVSAHAQFGNLLNSVKNIVDSVTTDTGQTQSANANPTASGQDFRGKFENGSVALNIYEDKQGNPTFTSSLCKGTWGMNNYGDKYEYGSLKVDGLSIKYSKDYSSLNLESIPKHSNCLPNGKYTRSGSGAQTSSSNRATSSKICSLLPEIADGTTYKDEGLKSESNSMLKGTQGWWFKVTNEISVNGKKTLVGQLCNSNTCDPQDIVGAKKVYTYAEEWNCK